MNCDLKLPAGGAAAERSIVIVAAVLGFCLAVSLIVFFLTPAWTKRVFFFPDVSSGKFVAEIRALPPASEPIDDIRLLLEDLLLGPSNFGNGPAFPAGTRLVSAMLSSDKELFVGFSRDIFMTEDTSAVPREMLQGAADTVYFNFPWVSNIRFFINGKELSDGPVLARTDTKFDLVRALVSSAADPKGIVRIADRHPLFDSIVSDLSGRNAYLFHGGARWDERILR